MKSINIYLLPLLISFISACSSTAEPGSPVELDGNKRPIAVTHFNVIITPDLSNRLSHPKPVSDQRIVNTLLHRVMPKALNYKRETNQKDIYSVAFVSKQAVSQYNAKTEDLKISFDHFKNQLQRINYIKGKSSTVTLSGDRSKFISEYNRIALAAAKSPDGADLWSFFNTIIDRNLIQVPGKVYEYGGKSFANVHRNILILLADGYIEAGMYGKKACLNQNQCYYLSGQRIKAFREAFKKSGTNDLQEFFRQGNYGIIPANNAALKDLEVLVLQMEDRSLSGSGNATVQPTDLEIVKLFWSDWLTKSKVKRFELRPIVASEEEAEKEILRFMGISS